MDKLNTIKKEYQRLKLLLINTIGNFPSHSKDWKKFESNNKSIALNILYVLHNTEKIRHAYKSKYNVTRESQVIHLMIIDDEKWHYLAVKRLSALFRAIKS